MERMGGMWINLSLCASTKASEKPNSVAPALTAIRSRAPLTAAHRSCRRSITSMKPTSVEDKLEDTHIDTHLINCDHN